MGLLHGFELLTTRKIDEINGEASLYRHVKTGARLLSISNDDDNKVFGISFRTPPSDSTGVAHILEHSVLCGSRKYPVREPFVELLKGSLKTFLNAMTYPDKTCYPVASQNTQDFYNLVDVYLDAVFFPRLTDHVFEQEGWHIELDPGKEPEFKGVVYNEMKGDYSSPESLSGSFSQYSLFPGTIYGLESGGDPEHITELTFEGLRGFHRRYYHPSNSWIYFYGNDAPEARLRILAEYLDQFDAVPVDSAIPLQASRELRSTVTRPFVDGADGDGAKGITTINWLLPEGTAPAVNIAMQVLEYILMGMPASPLRKALLDSGLGEGIAGQGLNNEIRQMYFSTGLRNIDPEKAPAMEALVLDTLEKIAHGGIDPRTIEAGLNTVEFRFRENNTGQMPRGLVLMLRALTTWLYDEDPCALLAFESPLDAVKKSYDRDGRFFESLIERYFLKNAHRTTVILKPDHSYGDELLRRERARVQAALSKLGEHASRDCAENTAKLKALQTRPDSPEALAKIPRLALADLDTRNKQIPSSGSNHGATRLLMHDIFTSGILYLDLGLDITRLPERFLPYLPLYGRALFEMGTKKEDYLSLSQRISGKTGGIRRALFSSMVEGAENPTGWMFLRGKTTVARAHELADILADILTVPDFSRKDRFLQILREEKSRNEARVVPNGTGYVDQRLRSRYTPADAAMETMTGLSYLSFLQRLDASIEREWESVRELLVEIHATLVDRNSIMMNITADSRAWESCREPVHNLIDALPAGSPSRANWERKVMPEMEALLIPARVNYVGAAANLYQFGYRYHGSVRVITRLLRTTMLWERVRVQGGAYGALCGFDRLSGVFSMLSYRDPNISATWRVFEEASRFLSTLDLPKEELHKGIIGAIGEIDAYLLPPAQGFVALERHLTGSTEEQRQRTRDEVLSTELSDFRAFASSLAEAWKNPVRAVMGSQETVSASDEGARGLLSPLKIL
ncbi:MAG: peptidase M16 [Spirochaetes bacterium]|nr:MAG: peptidase M16 [Spirochaetota bacterium]